MTARVRIPNGNDLIAAIERCKSPDESVFGVAEHHVGKTWIPVTWNPAHVAVAGARGVLS